MKINMLFVKSVTILILSTTISFGQMKKVAQAGMEFLEIGMSARAVGMGETYVAAGHDINSIFWNPAGMAYITEPQVSYTFVNWIADIQKQGIAAAAEFGDLGVFGVSVVWMDYGDIYATSVDFDPSNEFGYQGGKRFGGQKINVSEIAAGIAYGLSLTDKFSIGGQIKYVFQDLGDSRVFKNGSEEITQNSLGVVAMDFGTLYYVGYKDLRLAVSVRNFSKDVKYEVETIQLPLSYHFGVAMDLFSLFDFGESHKFTASIEAIHPRAFTERIHTGFEYVYNNTITLRGGYKFNYDEGGLTGGVGLRAESGLSFDYGYTAFGVFGAVHRISVGFIL